MSEPRSEGRWPEAESRASPNHDARPEGAQIELVVLHHISLPPGVFSGDAVCALFENRLDPQQWPELSSLRVSAHFFLRRDGQALQFVDCTQRAWHAGVSAWRGRTGCNDFSIGIELEGDAQRAFTEAQYQCLNRLLAWLQARYGGLALTTHGEIAAGRKQDPGPFFDFAKLNPPAASPGSPPRTPRWPI